MSDNSGFSSSISSKVFLVILIIGKNVWIIQVFQVKYQVIRDVRIKISGSSSKAGGRKCYLN